MKLTTLLCLVALTSAAHQATQTTAKAATAATHAKVATAATHAKRADDIADTAETTVDEGSYDAAPIPYASYHAPEICLGTCPKEAPCQNSRTGGCMPKSCHAYAPVQYASYEGDYGAEAVADKKTDRRLQEYDAAPAYAAYAPPQNCGCPYDTTDVWGCSRLNKRVTLWVAFALLIGPAFYFFYKAWESDTKTLKIDDETRTHRVVAGGICFIASLAYLTMALGYGYTVRCCDGREFYYARYVDWAITTPMMIWELVHLNAGVIKDSEKAFMYAIDFLMIISGLIGALICQNHKWAFFGFSILTFIPLLWFLCNLRNRAKEEANRVYNQVATITVVTWFFYPIVWIFAEGTNKLCAQGEAICYTVLDIISKSVFGWIIVNSAPVKTVSPVEPNGSSML